LKVKFTTKSRIKKCYSMTRSYQMKLKKMWFLKEISKESIKWIMQIWRFPGVLIIPLRQMRSCVGGLKTGDSVKDESCEPGKI
jgi:hypothetical protein